MICEQSGILLCQPDNLKGCSVCCGLFNHMDISMNNLENKLNGFKDPLPVDTHDILESTSKSAVRDISSHICRYQGFIAGNIPGCTLHPSVLGRDGRDRSLYGSRICSEYLCPAHEILDDRLKRLLISSIDGWYEYCIAIIDPEGFAWIVDCLGIDPESRSSVDISVANVLRLSLGFHGRYLARSKQSVFYYSLMEYNQNKLHFSLKYNTDEQSEISRFISVHFPVS